MMLPLFSHIHKYKNKLAVIDENGIGISYRELTEQANKLSGENTSKRQLVFIKAQNNYATVLAYVACVLANYPVLLVASENQQQIDELVNRYQPNILVDTNSRIPVFERLNERSIQLHSELSHLLSTSGSTGSPKLVKLSHTNICSNSDSIIKYLGLSSADKAITSLPIHYSYGLSVLNIHLRIGASVVMTELSVTDEKFWDLYRHMMPSHTITTVLYVGGIVARSIHYIRESVRDSFPNTLVPNGAEGPMRRQKINGNKTRIRKISEIGP